MEVVKLKHNKIALLVCGLDDVRRRLAEGSEPIGDEEAIDLLCDVLSKEHIQDEISDTIFELLTLYL